MENLGIQPISLLTQIINFAIMVVVLTKFLYKPILKVIEERKKKIEESLELTEKLKKDVEKNEQKRLEIIDEARAEGKKIIEEVKKSAKQMEAELVRKAQAEAAAIVEKSKKEIEAERGELEKKLKEQTVEIAAAMAEKIISEVLSEKDHRNIIEKKLKEIARLSP